MVHVIPMSETDFQEYRSKSIEEYAQENVKAGNSDPSEALQQAEQEFQHVFPQGLASKNQYICSIQDRGTGSKVGMFWFAVREGPSLAAFIYDFRIYEDYQRRGYGTQGLQALDEKVKELGINKVVLHVFGHNQAAIALYKKAGYEMVDMRMAKILG